MQRYLRLQHIPQGQYLGILQSQQNSASPQLNSPVSDAGGLEASELTLHNLQSSIGVESWNSSSRRSYSSLALGLYQHLVLKDSLGLPRRTVISTVSHLPFSSFNTGPPCTLSKPKKGSSSP